MWGGEESDRQGLTQGHSWPGSWSGAVYQKGTRPKAQLSQVNWISKQGFKGHCLSNKEQGKSWVIVTGHSAMTREPPVPCPKLIPTRCSSVGSWWTGHSNSIGAVRCISISNSLDACPAMPHNFNVNLPHYSRWHHAPGQNPWAQSKGMGTWTQRNGDKKALGICTQCGKRNEKSGIWTEQAQILLRWDSA